MWPSKNAALNVRRAVSARPSCAGNGGQSPRTVTSAARNVSASKRACAWPPCATILLDCPPGQGLLVINALAAATHVLIPVSPEEMAVDGMRLFLTTLAEAKRARLNPRLAISGILVTRVDDTRDARAQMDEIRATVEPPHIPIVGTIRERTIVKQACAGSRRNLSGHRGRNGTHAARR